MRDTHTHTQRERQRHRQREKQALCREPDMGLNPGSPGSHPRLKAALNHWATRATLLLTLDSYVCCTKDTMVAHHRLPKWILKMNQYNSSEYICYNFAESYNYTALYNKSSSLIWTLVNYTARNTEKWKIYILSIFLLTKLKLVNAQK